MKERLLHELLPPVRHNCRVSDANFWGYYSLCGLLLRLRELYRFERSIPFGQPTVQEEVEEWIGGQETLWSELEDAPLEPLELGGVSFEPFDTDGVNRILLPHGLIYGAGYGVAMKPLFFLADLDREENLDGCRVFTAGREYARDLSLHPAMLRDRTVVARSQVTEVLIGQKHEELRMSKKKSVLDRAFREYGVTAAMSPEQLRAVAAAELRTYIHHELGEAAVETRLDPAWTALIASLSHGRAAAFMHDVRDVLADTIDGGMIHHIIEEGKAGSLAFFLSFLSGFRRPLLCRVSAAFRDTDSGADGDLDWETVEAGRRHAFEASLSIADRILRAGEETGGDGEALEALVVEESRLVYAG